MASFNLVHLGSALAAIILVGAVPARADELPTGPQNCSQQINELSGQWNAIAFPPNAKPAQARSSGRGGHSHPGAEVTFMQDQIRIAAHLCKDGKEHEAMLRMDVVRAILKLPEVEHPAGHNYSPPPR